MKFTVVGPGAIGLLLGSLLHMRGYDVEFICKDPQQMKELSDGVFMEGIVSYSFVPRVKLMYDGDSDYIFVTVKSYDTQKALEKIGDFDVTLVSVQNGIGNYELMCKKFEKVIIGVTTCASTKLARNRIKFVSPGITLLGDPKNEFHEEVDELIDILNGMGLPARKSENILKDLWIKTSVNAVINTLTSIFCVKNGEIMRNEKIGNIAKLLIKDCEEILRTKGYYVNLESIVFDVIKSTADNVSSSLQDILRGKKTEVDYFIKPLLENKNSMLLESIYYMVKSKEWVKCPE